jgi:hydroxyacylglutathione hydrolase
LQSARALPALVNRSAWIVDLRPADRFARGFVPGTLSVPISRTFSTWAGWLLPYDVDVYLLTDEIAAGDTAPDSVRRAVHDLAMIGLDRIAGWFDVTAIAEWESSGSPLGQVEQIDAVALAARREREPLAVIDVRGASEYEAGHLPDSRNIPVGFLLDQLDTLPRDRPLVVQCQSGARSAIAASVLLRAGREHVLNLTSGYVGWRDAGLPIDRGTAVAP